jgi:hypothetical protein
VTLRAGEGENSPFVKLGVGVLLGAKAANLIYRSAHGQHQGTRRLGSITSFQHCGGDWKLRGAPAAIPPRRPEAHNFFLEYGNV